MLIALLEVGSFVVGVGGITFRSESAAMPLTTRILIAGTITGAFVSPALKTNVLHSELLISEFYQVNVDSLISGQSCNDNHQSVVWHTARCSIAR